MKEIIIRWILDPIIDWSVNLKYKWIVKKEYPECMDEFPEGIYYLPVNEIEGLLDEDRTLH